MNPMPMDPKDIRMFLALAAGLSGDSDLTTKVMALCPTAKERREIEEALDGATDFGRFDRVAEALLALAAAPDEESAH